MTLSWPKPNRTFGFIDALGLLGVLGFVVARYVPVARLPFWGCALRSATGWPCPGCGLTRAAEHLAHGRVASAIEANPLGAACGLLFALAAIASVLHLACKLPIPSLKLSPFEARLVRTAVVALAVVNYAFVVVKTKWF